MIFTLLTGEANYEDELDLAQDVIDSLESDSGDPTNDNADDDNTDNDEPEDDDPATETADDAPPDDDEPEDE